MKRRGKSSPHFWLQKWLDKPYRKQDQSKANQGPPCSTRIPARLSPGRSLEGFSNKAPRRMIINNKTRLIDCLTFIFLIGMLWFQHLHPIES